MGEVVRLGRCVFRKISRRPSANGWVGQIVGFDARFYSSAVSKEYPTRTEAIRAAEAASRKCGLPFIAIETITGADKQGDAA